MLVRQWFKLDNGTLNFAESGISENYLHLREVPLDKTIDTLYTFRSSDFWFHLNRVGYKEILIIQSSSVNDMFHLNRVGYKAETIGYVTYIVEPGFIWTVWDIKPKSFSKRSWIIVAKFHLNRVGYKAFQNTAVYLKAPVSSEPCGI